MGNESGRTKTWWYIGSVLIILYCLFPVLWVGFWVNLTSGLMLLMTNATHDLTSPIFGAKITFTGRQKVKATDGPFTEAKELVGGFWIIQAQSKEEAIKWMSQAPFPAGTTLELRQLAEVEDFPDFKADLADDERKWREKSGYAEKK